MKSILLITVLALFFMVISRSHAEESEGRFVIVEGNVVRLSCDLEKHGNKIRYKDCAMNNCSATDNAAGLFDLKTGTLYVLLDQKTDKAPKEILKELELQRSMMVAGFLFEEQDTTPIIYVTSMK